jgi:hypothetical protein
MVGAAGEAFEIGDDRGQAEGSGWTRNEVVRVRVAAFGTRRASGLPMSPHARAIPVTT